MLEIGVGYADNSPPSGAFPCVALDDDGYLCFLWPYFHRLAAETGKEIDPYGFVVFDGEDLDALNRALQAARGNALLQPECWTVAHHEPIQRDVLLSMIDRCKSAIEAARELGRPIVCFGE